MDSSTEQPETKVVETNTTSTTSETPLTSENMEAERLKLLKQRAKTMGLAHSPNIGADTLEQKINEKLSGAKPAIGGVSGAENLEEENQDIEGETKQQRRVRLIKESSRLVRCRIYNMNPTKADLEGEVITVGNGVIGTFRKFVAFGEKTDGGYHIPKIIFDHLVNQKFQQTTTRNVKGKIEVNTRKVPEYNIEVLPPLTKEELKELGDQQSAASRLSTE